MGKSRSRSRSRSRGRKQSRSSSQSSRSSSGGSEGVRIHIGNLSVDCTKITIEKTFEKYGPLLETWVASYPPCFAFVVFRYRDDAEEAVREMDGKVIGRNHVRISFALPRSRGRRSRGYDPNMRCYQCGQPGHFSRECRSVVHGYRRYSNSRSKSRSRSRDRRRSRDMQSRSQDMQSRYQDKRSKSRDRRSSSRDRKRRDSGRKDESSPSKDKSRPRRESYHDEGRRESTRDRRDSEPSRRRHSDGRGDEPSPKHQKQRESHSQSVGDRYDD